MPLNNSEEAAPIRVFVRGSKIYISFYAGGKHRFSTGITADIKHQTNNPDWWRSSKHAAAIAEQVNIAIATREALLKKQRKQRQKARRRILDIYLPQDEPLPAIESAPTRLEEIADLYHRHVETMGGSIREGTIVRRKNALKLLRRFKPDYKYSDIDSDFLFDFRQWLKTANNGRPFAASTMTGYAVDYRTIINFGIKRKLLAEPNPFEDYVFRAAPTMPARKTAWDEEQRIYRLCWAENRPLFFQLVFQRLTGFRVTWVCDLLWKEIGSDRVTSVNKKSGRYEDFPITAPLAWLINEIKAYRQQFTPYVFKFRNRSTVYSGLRSVCNAAGVQSFGTHKLKKNNASEWRRYTGDPDIVNFLSHHSISGPTRVSRAHYVDPEEIFELAKETLERSQVDKWMAFFALLDRKDESSTITRWSNPKGDWKSRYERKYYKSIT